MRLKLGLAALLAALALSLAYAGPPAYAADFPDRTIRIFNGPSPETIPRLFAERLNRRWNVPVIVEARAGAGGEIAAKALSAADPDGYTLLFTTSSFTLNSALKLASYDFLKDFEPVAVAGVYPFVLIVNKELPASSVQDLVALAKAKPGTLNCGSAGQGTAPHLACELFNRIAGVETVHVPFREANAAMNALLGGHVQFSFAVSTAARAQIDGCSVRALGITAATPSPMFSGVPPLSEAGLTGFDLRGWGGFVAPAGTPKPVVDKLNAAITGDLKEVDVQSALARIGTEAPPPYTAAEARAFMTDDIARWNRIIDVGQVPRGRTGSQ